MRVNSPSAGSALIVVTFTKYQVPIVKFASSLATLILAFASSENAYQMIESLRLSGSALIVS